MQNKKAFKEIEECIMLDAKPSDRIRALAEQTWFREFPFSLILKEQVTEQSPIHHPEGSVWEHTLLALDEAAKIKGYSTDPRAFMWAALLHDIGKPETTKVRNGKITAYNHDRRGAELARDFLLALTDESDFIEKAVWIVRYHMQILFVTKSMPFADMAGMKKHTSIYDIALLGYCDRFGRKNVDAEAELNAIRTFLQKCGENPDSPWLIERKISKEPEVAF